MAVANSIASAAVRTEATSNIWDRFPLALCINLKERDDRHQEALAEFKKVGLDQVTFYRTTRQENRNKGCIDSHMACLQYAVDRGVPYALVFEDDVLFLPDYEEKMRRVLDFVTAGNDWKIFYLGGFIFRKVRRLTPHILQGGVLCTQGYIIKTDFARELLKHRAWFDNRLISVDLFYSMMVWNAALIHFNPLVCIQRPSASDGTWDNRNLAKAGWLGNAMLYSSLDFRDRWRSDLFPFAEKMKIRNGLMFFVVYRWFLFFQQHAIHALRRLRGTKQLSAHPGEFIEPSRMDQTPKSN